MKSKNILLIIIFTLLTSMSVMLTSCDVKNPVDGLEVRIKNITRTTYVSVKIYDAATGNLVTENVEVIFSGASKDKIISSTNTPVTSLTSAQGLLSFSFADDVIPSASTPVKLNLICTANGYLNTSKPIQIFETGTSSFEIVMTSVDNTPAGVISNTEETGEASGSGGTSEDIILSSGEDISSGASAAISIPSGTVLLDKDNNPLVGDVSTRITYFNPLDESSTNAFPGGFNVTVENESGEEEEGGFVTAGFVAIDMTVGGQSVEGFSNGSLSIDIEVPQGTVNPTTGELIKIGDKIPLWSYDEDLAEWKYEQEVEVTTLIPTTGLSKMSNKMGVRVSGISHLSYFNLDWFTFYETTCWQGATLNLVNSSGGCFKVNVEVIDNATSQPASFWKTKTFTGVDSEEIEIYYSVANHPVTINVYDNVTDDLLFSKIVNNLCETAIVDLPFTPSLGGFQTVTINLAITCDSQTDNPTGLSPDGFPLLARKVTSTGDWNGDWFDIGAFKDGSLSYCLETGSFYEFAVEYDGQWYYSLDYEAPFEINSSVIDYKITDDSRICDDL
jgi:hypothetical protein